MDLAPYDVIREIFERITDTRPLGGVNRALRAVFLAVDGPFWRARGVRRARLATPRTATLVCADNLIAADNLAALLHKRMIDPDSVHSFSWKYTSVVHDSSTVFISTIADIDLSDPDQVDTLMMMIMRHAAVKCFNVISSKVSAVPDYSHEIMGGETSTRSMLAKLRAMEEIILTNPTMFKIGNSPISTYIIAKTTTGSAVRNAAAVAAASMLRRWRLAPKWQKLLHTLAPDVFPPHDHLLKLAAFLSDIFLMWRTFSNDVTSPFVITRKMTVAIGYKIFKLRRRRPELLSRFAQLLAPVFPAGAVLCNKFALERAHTN